MRGVTFVHTRLCQCSKSYKSAESAESVPIPPHVVRHALWLPEAQRKAMMPAGTDETASTRHISPGEVSGGSGGEIQRKNAENGVATRLSEAQQAGPLPQDSTEGMPERKDDKAAPVSNSLALF